MDTLYNIFVSQNENYHINITETICDLDTLKIENKPYYKSGFYKISLNSRSGCDSIINLDLSVNPTYNETEEVTICKGDTYNGWIKSGTYLTTLTTSYGCDSIITTNLTVENFDPSPFIAQAADTLLSNYANGNQWYLNDEIMDNETSQTLVIPQSGEYYTIITSQNGCISEPSNVINATHTLVNELENNLFKVYPNPASNTITVELQNNSSPFKIKLFNLTWQKVLEKHSERTNTEVDVSLVPKGVYILKVLHNEYSKTEKIIIE